MTDQERLACAREWLAKYDMNFDPCYGVLAVNDQEELDDLAALLARVEQAAVKDATPEIERKVKVEALKWAAKEAHGWATAARSKKRRGENEANSVREDEACTCQAFGEHVEAELTRLQGA